MFKNKNNNNNYIKRKKKMYNAKSINLNKNVFKNICTIINKAFYQQKPYKKFLISSTYTNFNLVLPGIDGINIGKIMYNFNTIYSNKKIFFFKGFVFYIYLAPINVLISNVTNNLNSKITYAKAGGTYCKIRKSKKSKKKLIKIVLPSNKEILVNKMTKSYLGKNTNFKISQLIEGKWGYGFHKTKHINVRGVAMNPVDHPNGGRTKTVKPEKSPWNWIAKKKK